MIAWAVFACFALAVAAPLLSGVLRGVSGRFFALLPLTLFVMLALHASAGGSAPLTQTVAWMPALNVDLAFRIDGLSMLFVLLITGIGACVFVYADGYMAGRERNGSFYGFLLFFMGSMLGLVTSDGFVALFVFWELTSISSFFLIGHDRDSAQSRASALQALLVTAGGGLALLAGLLMLGTVSGVWRFSDLPVRDAALLSHALYPVILALVVAGAFTKSAQFPFHFWLPNAMAAPTPVSSYLHSSTMVKAGVYLLARLLPNLGGTAAWRWTLVVVGTATVVAGVRLAARQDDLKKHLAYMTVTALGVLVVLIGMDTPQAAAAAVVFLFAHALYKAPLFMTAGAIDHGTGSRDPEKLSGLARHMPWSAGIACLAAFSMIGLPPLMGFLGKEILFETALDSPNHWLFIAAFFVAEIAFVAVASLMLRPFFSRTPQFAGHPHEAPATMLVPAGVLAAAGLVLALFGAALSKVVLTPAAEAMRTGAGVGKLAFWHGFTPVVAISVAVLATGAALYVLRARLRHAVHPFGAEAVYQKGMESIFAGAAAVTRTLQSGKLRYYLRTLIFVTVALPLVAFARHRFVMPAIAAADVSVLPAAGLSLLMIAGAVATLFAQSRLTAVATVGVVGVAMSLVFVVFGAPDLAMTQFTIETLTVILLALVLHRMPPRALASPVKILDVVLALSAGALMTAFVLFATAGPATLPAISTFYAEHSLPGAHGRNIVNVILVDFRALDTLGEITVLAVAGIGVYSLLKLRAKRR